VTRCWIALGAALTLVGCAHSSVVLLPDEEGGHGALAIASSTGEGDATIVSDANMRATLGSRPSVRPLGAKGLNSSEAALIAALPPPAKSFTLYFQEGTTEIRSESTMTLDAIRAEVARRPGAEVQVTGHTDTVGSDEDNDSLSRKRAAEILDALASQGFSREMMSAVGRGERQLRQSTADNVSSPVNRRVEVIVR